MPSSIFVSIDAFLPCYQFCEAHPVFLVAPWLWHINFLGCPACHHHWKAYVDIAETFMLNMVEPAHSGMGCEVVRNNILKVHEYLVGFLVVQFRWLCPIMYCLLMFPLKFWDWSHLGYLENRISLKLVLGWGIQPCSVFKGSLLDFYIKLSYIGTDILS